MTWGILAKCVYVCVSVEGEEREKECVHRTSIKNK